MTEHTPTPWSVRPNTGMLIRALHGLADGYDEYKIGELSSHSLIGDDEAVANAAFIVEAVNNHEALKARVKELEEHLKALLDMPIVCNVDDDVIENSKRRIAAALFLSGVMHD